jgi:hypothetical protein
MIERPLGIPTHHEVETIFNSITERFIEPVPIGGRCESEVFYRVQDLNDNDLNTCARFVAARLRDAVYPAEPQLFLKLPGGYSFFAERLVAVYSEWFNRGEEMLFEQYLDSKFSNGFAERFRGMNAILVTDVITTAKSSLETHTKATLRGIRVLSWATLIDRTLGPGPVAVISAVTGEPVRMLSGI